MPYYIGYINHRGDKILEGFRTHDLAIKGREQIKMIVNPNTAVSAPILADSKKEAEEKLKFYI